MPTAIKTINPFTNIPLADLPEPSENDQGGTFLSNLRSLNIGDGGDNVFRADKQGIWLGAEKFVNAPFKVSMAGEVTASSLILTGGTIKYGKTSFSDDTHTGYYFGVEGLYAGKIADTTLFKFTIATGALDYTGKVLAGVGSELPAGYVTGTLTASQISSVNATSITGSITASQIGSVNASVLVGNITAGQITSITAGQITGTLTASQIGSVNATAITGLITADQIGSIHADDITGSITADHISTVNATSIVGSITADQISTVNATSITGLISAGQISTITAGQITGAITATYLSGSINATQITGSITADQIQSVNSSSIFGAIVASQIGSVNASAITGSISSTQIGSVAATTITGSITAGQIGSLNAAVINGVIVTSQLADEIINALSLFATNLRPIVTVNVLPTLPDDNYPVGSTVYLTTDMKLYRNVGGTWSASAAASDITGQLTALQIGSVNSTSITGLILAGQISSINVGQVLGHSVDVLPTLPDTNYPIGCYVLLTTDGKLYRNAANVWTVSVDGGDIIGSIQAGQIGSVNASAIIGTITASQITSLSVTQLTGQLVASQIQSVNATAITGSITASQISSVNATSITGLIQADQIDSVNATDITGAITSSQIQSIEASKITGSITSSQISSVSATAITGSITSSQITSIAASKITGQIDADQIDSVNASAILGTIVAGQIGSVNANVIGITLIQSGQIGSVNAGTINAGQLRVGGTSEPSAIIIAQSLTSGSNAKITWVGGSRMWEDASDRIGINSIGSPMYIYVNSTQRMAIPSSGQATINGGISTDGNVNLTGGSATLRLNSGYLCVNTTSGKSERLYVDGNVYFTGGFTCGHHDPRASASYNLGGATNWWLYVNCHSVSTHSMGYFDRGVKIMKDGILQQVSDTEAIKSILPHPTLKTEYGIPVIDKRSLPQGAFLAARDQDGKLYPRDKVTGLPIVEKKTVTYGKDGEEIIKKENVIMDEADGADLVQLVGMTLGAIKELDSRVKELENIK